MGDKSHITTQCQQGESLSSLAGMDIVAEAMLEQENCNKNYLNQTSRES